jgi:nitrite reductase (NADH) large subunit
MVSGHAYGKSLRTVKTCVGGMVPLWHAGFHRPWHQDRADDLGQLDAAQVQDRRIGLPAQLRRSDDQGLRRDLRGLGYELHVGGNGGIHLRGTDLLCKVTTEQEALDVCAAFIQLYREQAGIWNAPRPGSSASGWIT